MLKVYFCGPLYLHKGLSLLCGPFTPIQGLSQLHGTLSPLWAALVGRFGVVCTSSFNSIAYRDDWQLHRTCL